MRPAMNAGERMSWEGEIGCRELTGTNKVGAHGEDEEGGNPACEGGRKDACVAVFEDGELVHHTNTRNCSRLITLRHDRKWRCTY